MDWVKLDLLFYFNNNRDAPPHYLDYSSVEPYTPEMVLAGVQKMTDMITLYFPDIRVFPTLGNHDNYLADQLAPPPKGSDWLNKIASIWSHWLPQETLETFTYGGYYTLLIEDGLRLISLNTIYCDILNTWALLDSSYDIANQMKWLNLTLENARQNNEKVYLIGHIPPGFTEGGNPQMFKWCNTQYYQVYSEFSDIIINRYNNNLILFYKNNINV